MELSAPIYELKRRAKLLRRQTGVTHNTALDQIAAKEGFENWSILIHRYEVQKPKPSGPLKVGCQITSLPFDARYRAQAIDQANYTFEEVIRRIEPDNPTETRALWDVDDYIDNHHLNEGVLPIDSEYALSLIEAFLWHHVVDLAVRADEISA